jgi:hypothetical protein
MSDAPKVTPTNPTPASTPAPAAAPQTAAKPGEAKAEQAPKS